MNENTVEGYQQKPSIMPRVLGILIPILIFLGFMLLVIGAKSIEKKPDAKKKQRPAFAVLATTAVADNVQLSVNAQGESRPRTEIDLVPEVAGKIVYVSPKFLSGGLFTKGEVLYRIDPADYNVGVIRAEASVARAQQVLTREEAEGAIAAQDWEDLGEGREASALTLRQPQLLEARAGLQSAQADLQNAQLRLERTSVKAPFNGRVNEKTAGLGQYVNPGSRLGRIFSTDIAEVRVALNDADLAKLDLPVAYFAKSADSAPDVEITATIGGKLRTWNGKIMRTDSTYDTKTRSLFAIAEVTDPYGAGAAEGGYPLAPGLFVDVKIKGKGFQSVIVIPRDGLRSENVVYVVNDDGVAEMRPVTVIDKNPKRAVIASGLGIGEYVILSPLEKSQISLKFKALDVNDPSVVLVEPKPDEDEEDVKKDEDENADEKDKTDNKEENADAVKKRRKGKRDKKSSGAD